MSKKTKQKKQEKIQNELNKFSEISESLLINKKIEKKYILFSMIFALLLAAGSSIYFILQALSVNGYFCFPLDDPWIHLTFAKNFIEYGSFSYFRNEVVTSGSTSPIYTLILSLFYLISKNEYVISYVLGIGMWLLAVYFGSKLFSIHFSDGKIVGILTLILLALQPKLNLISVSGMETTMFLFLIIATLYFYKTSNKIMLGIFLGLTIWCRPDGFVLWIAIIIDYVLKNNYFLREKTSNGLTKKDFLIAFGLALSFVVIYFLFNYTLSGSILPNTFKAKLEYYQNNLRENFLKHEVIDYFTSAEMIVLWIPFLLAVIKILLNFFKKHFDEFIIYFLFIIGFIGIYYIQLPFAHRFGRYLMPVIPFYILIAVYSINFLSDFLVRKTKSAALSNVLTIIFFGAGILLSFTNLKANENEYTLLCKYHYDRHVAAGKWINKNTPVDAVIAVHDIGAIGFYGDRKIIDMVGLVTPELINHLNDKNYASYINEYLTKNKVSYIATLKNWFEVVNDNPLFVPTNEFEVLEIFKYHPGRTHIQAKEATIINEQAMQLVRNNNLNGAISYLLQSLNYDPASSRTYFLLGATYEMAKDFKNAETYFNKSILIFPDNIDANLGLARLYYNTGKFEEAKKFAEKCLSLKPDNEQAKEIVNLILTKEVKK